MFCFCLESSHERGMGHFYRVLNIIEYLKSKEEKFLVCINKDNEAIFLLNKYKIPFEIVNLRDINTNWEIKIINKYEIKIWFNDRLNTDIEHSKKVKSTNIKLITMDDRGEGSSLADINFIAHGFADNENIKGKKVCRGLEYLVLNKEIDQYQRFRNEINNILVTMGGSDTYGITIKIIKILKKINKKATIIIGPSFKHLGQLKNIINKNFIIKKSVPSLIQEFYNYDLAITAAGLTPFEANASGLPCIIIAAEPHEINSAKLLEKIGSSIFAGYYDNIDESVFTKELPVFQMSQIGMDSIKTNAVDRIFREITML